MNSQVIKTVYLSSEGRLGRLAYFCFGLAIGLVYAVIATILGMLLGPVGGIIALIFYVALLYLHYNLTAKRFHDLNQPSQYAIYVIILAVVAGVLAQISSLHLVSMLLSLLLLVAGLYLLFMPGTAGANSYGAAPETFPRGS
jgi:uncharacterized membrane protein YhaH (DUF805 family)